MPHCARIIKIYVYIYTIVVLSVCKIKCVVLEVYANTDILYSCGSLSLSQSILYVLPVLVTLSSKNYFYLTILGTSINKQLMK